MKLSTEVRITAALMGVVPILGIIVMGMNIDRITLLEAVGVVFLTLVIPAGVVFGVWALDRFQEHLHPKPDSCPSCGYNLKGLSWDRPCPECGSGPVPRGRRRF